MENMQLEVPLAWQEILSGALSGTIMLLGAPDTGKSTLARYLYERLAVAVGGWPAWTVTRTDKPGAAGHDDPGHGYGDGLPAAGPPLAALRWIGIAARAHASDAGWSGRAGRGGAGCRIGCDHLRHQWTGGSGPGGTALKLAKIDLLRPEAIIAIQREDELEPLLQPLRRVSGLRLHELRPSPAVAPRDPAVRRAHRADRFAAHFAGARPVLLRWDRLAVWPAPDFIFRQLVALEDSDGFVLGLGIVQGAEAQKRE